MLDKQVQAGKVRYLGNSLLMPQMRNQIEKSDEYGISVLQTTYATVRWANAWCLQNDAVHTIIPGVKTVGRLKENAQASELL